MNASIQHNATAQENYSCLPFRSVPDQQNTVVVSNTDVLLSGKLSIKAKKRNSLDFFEKMGNYDDCDSNKFSLKRTVCEMNGPAQQRRRLSLNGLLSSTQALSLYTTADECDQQEANKPMIASHQHMRLDEHLPSQSRAVRFVDPNVSIDGLHPEQKCVSPSNYDSDIHQYEYETLPLNEENEVSVHRRKRRRFERRNSKTPAMLMSIISPMFNELQEDIFLNAETDDTWNILQHRNNVMLYEYQQNDCSQGHGVSRKKHVEDTPLMYTKEDSINDSIAAAEKLIHRLRQRAFYSSNDDEI
jgi:hypothetical protein